MFFFAIFLALDSCYYNDKAALQTCLKTLVTRVFLTLGLLQNSDLAGASDLIGSLHSVQFAFFLRLTRARRAQYIARHAVLLARGERGCGYAAGASGLRGRAGARACALWLCLKMLGL